jgi:hypothetical protein
MTLKEMISRGTFSGLLTAIEVASVIPGIVRARGTSLAQHVVFARAPAARIREAYRLVSCALPGIISVFGSLAAPLWRRPGLSKRLVHGAFTCISV